MRCYALWYPTFFLLKRYQRDSSRADETKKRDDLQTANLIQQLSGSEKPPSLNLFPCIAHPFMVLVFVAVYANLKYNFSLKGFML